MHTLLASTLVIELLRSSRVVRTHYLLAISRAGKHVPNINLSLARVSKSSTRGFFEVLCRPFFAPTPQRHTKRV